jgi:hypothetical protein
MIKRLKPNNYFSPITPIEYNSGFMAPMASMVSKFYTKSAEEYDLGHFPIFHESNAQILA